jgi:hypothetical protein
VTSHRAIGTPPLMEAEAMMSIQSLNPTAEFGLLLMAS